MLTEDKVTENRCNICRKSEV